MTKAYRKLSSAKDHGQGNNIILRVGDLYIPIGNPQDNGGVSIDLIAAGGTITGTVTTQHLDRLGNANWATVGKATPYYAFKCNTPTKAV